MDTKQPKLFRRNTAFSIREYEAEGALAHWLDGEAAWWLPYLPDLLEEFQVWHRQMDHARGYWRDGYDFGDD